MWNVRSVFAQHFPLRFNVRQLSSGQLINRIFIDGQWRSTNCTFPVHSPADGRLIGEAPETSPDQLVEAIESSSSAFQNWSTRSGRERSAFIRRLFDLQCKHSEHLAWIISKEMGKPLSEARTEIVYGGSFFEWFAEQAKRVNGELLTSPWAGHQVSIHREPIGPVAIVTPVRHQNISTHFLI